MSDASEAGFTLLEIVIALIIAGLALGVIVPAMSYTLRRGSEDSIRQEAAVFASSLLDQIGTIIPLKDGTTTRATPRMKWTITISLWCPDGPDHCQNQDSAVSLHEVNVRVASTEHPEATLASLDTLRLAPPLR